MLSQHFWANNFKCFISTFLNDMHWTWGLVCSNACSTEQLCLRIYIHVQMLLWIYLDIGNIWVGLQKDIRTWFITEKVQDVIRKKSHITMDLICCLCLFVWALCVCPVCLNAVLSVLFPVHCQRPGLIPVLALMLVIFTPSIFNTFPLLNKTFRNPHIWSVHLQCTSKPSYWQ